VAFTLFADDGETYNFEQNDSRTIILSWKEGKGCIQEKGSFKGCRYSLGDWNKVKLN
jgi:hypothetical protein